MRVSMIKNCFYTLILLYGATLAYGIACQESSRDMQEVVTYADEESEILLPDSEDATVNDAHNEEVHPIIELQENPRTLNAIIITGNQSLTKEALLNKIPYRVGEIFNPLKTRQLIRTLYFDLKRIRNIQVAVEEIGTDRLNLHIAIEEKKPLKEIIFNGRSALSEKEINEKINYKDIPAIDPEEIEGIAQKLKRMYIDKGYYRVTIARKIVEEDNAVTIIFDIDESKCAVVKRISFRGNCSISSKQLRSVIYTKEDWLLSFLDRAGTYQPDRIEADKHMIEQLYQNNGFLTAKVLAVIPEIDPVTQHVHLIYEIKEGDLYRIGELSAKGNELLPEDFLLSSIPLRTGQLYSRERIVDAIKVLETLWGNLGYIFAHIEPSIEPDSENKTVKVGFVSELGEQVYLNKLSIKGNRKTRDKVIRRQITLDEGELLTNSRMEESKGRVESLGYFDQRDGVNWKINRLDDDQVNLDLMVKETKTGHAGFQLGFNGSDRSIKTPLKGVSLDLGVSDTNIAGTGIRGNLMGRLSHEDLTFLVNVTQPWMFDKPIFGSFDVYHKRLAYDDFHFANAMNERDTGASATAGFITSFGQDWLQETFVRSAFGVDSIHYEQPPQVFIPFLPEPQRTIAQAEYKNVLDHEFRPGNYGTFTLQMGQERRNHPMHPTGGYNWLARSIVAFNSSEGILGYYKADLDAHWFTPLIGSRDLIFHLHGYVGVLTPLRNKIIPYRELFHIGGPASVRGFLYGQIGPQFAVVNPEGEIESDSIGGKKAAFINAELIFPITPDFNMKALLFYDGGAGWDNPYADVISPQFLLNNHFSYRHAVGFGVRMINPTPIRIDWGFKLDPRDDESGYEVHFSMTYDW